MNDEMKLQRLHAERSRLEGIIRSSKFMILATGRGDENQREHNEIIVSNATAALHEVNDLIKQIESNKGKSLKGDCE
ncbi:hypothetical protein [Erysipelothrix anatis]|uniref:hypothetical protein n=1 Tax=Erysipelothrix anatis TaxID=2683713 RepID=UPI00140DA1D3|nr:hypothetical protein [Erysipelothrix anatis]